MTNGVSVIAGSAGIRVMIVLPGVRSRQVEQLLVKPAESAVPVDEVDFEDPVAFVAGPVFSPHRTRRSGCDVRLDVLAVDLLVRELADQVTGDHPAEVPADVAAHGYDEVIQLLTGDLWFAAEVVTARLPDLW